MPLAEGAALAVLAGKANGRAFEHERAECEGFAERPVDRAALLECLGARLDEALDLGVELETGGHAGKAADAFFEQPV